MWSKHLSQETLLGLAEQRGTARNREHAERCDRCRQDVEALRATLAAMRDVEVPEPSPLFWNHLSARISQAIASGRTPASPAPWVRVPAWRSGVWLAGAAVAAAFAVMATWRPAGRSPLPATSVVEAEPGSTTDAAALAQGDAEWEFLLSVAGVAEQEPSGDLIEGVQPGMADRALLALSETERTALVELLETEMRQPGS